jgi:RimJ/RimL family protein N-acetyltransferase
MAMSGDDIRRLEPVDVPALRAFLERLPEGERRWFKDDVLEPTVVEAWARDEHARHLVRIDETGRVIAYGAIHPGRGWSSHVGEMTLMVDPQMRRRGVGREMARSVLVEALRLGLRKVVVEVVADQPSAEAMFRSMGFEPEAMLRDHIRDRGGQLRDLVVLSHPVEENWGVMAATGVEDALA